MTTAHRRLAAATLGVLASLTLLASLDLGALAQTRPAAVRERWPPPRPASLPRTKPDLDKPAVDQPKTQPAMSPAPVSATPAASDAACLQSLSAIPGNLVRPPDPKTPIPSDPACRVSEPVVVEALALRNADGAGQIRLDPPVTVSCTMARTIALWLDTSLQPLARGHFGQDLTRLHVGGGHECRRRNRANAGPLSEHSTGQALDIFAFGVGKDGGDGFKVVVEKPMGLAQTRFLQAVRHSACGAFATSIGPGADAAHANHLHLDIQARRSASTRFCQ